MNDHVYTANCNVIMLITVIAFAVYFRSVWVRGGYEGKNRILELFEVNRVWLHVVGFIMVLVMENMIFSQREYTHYAWVGVITMLGGICGSEVYMDIKKSLKQFKHGKTTEEKDD